MLILELFSDENTPIEEVHPTSLDETKMAWGRSGNKVVRKYRCSIGRLKGKIVSSPGACFKAPDIRKRIKLKMTKAKLGSRMKLKSKRTKRINPASKRVQALNKRS
mgnify:FL=1|jgi:hypothetical protein|tara:strand:+ start:738 stop:1055 length:318 start_codon:yes stop_codon:yes gene_type:complete